MGVIINKIEFIVQHKSHYIFAGEYAFGTFRQRPGVVRTDRLVNALAMKSCISPSMYVLHTLYFATAPQQTEEAQVPVPRIIQYCAEQSSVECSEPTSGRLCSLCCETATRQNRRVEVTVITAVELCTLYSALFTSLHFTQVFSTYSYV